MRVIHDNFGNLPTNAWELALAVQNDGGIEKLIALYISCSRWHVVKHPLSIISIEEKNRGGFRSPTKTKIQLYVAKLLDLFLKRNKRITDTLITQKVLSLLGHLKSFILKALRTLNPSWKQDIERGQPQAPASRNCTCSH